MNLLLTRANRLENPCCRPRSRPGARDALAVATLLLLGCDGSLESGQAGISVVDAGSTPPPVSAGESHDHRHHDHGMAPDTALERDAGGQPISPGQLATDARIRGRPPRYPRGQQGDAQQAGGNSGQVVEFRIKAGTGSKAWNSRDNPVIVPVGAVLRIYNDDGTVPHALHTNGGVPCPHGGSIRADRPYDCHFRQAWETGVTGEMHDHYHGSGDNEADWFWVRTDPPPG